MVELELVDELLDDELELVEVEVDELELDEDEDDDVELDVVELVLLEVELLVVVVVVGPVSATTNPQNKPKNSVEAIGLPVLSLTTEATPGIAWVTAIFR